MPAYLFGSAKSSGDLKARLGGFHLQPEHPIDSVALLAGELIEGGGPLLRAVPYGGSTPIGLGLYAIHPLAELAERVAALKKPKRAKE
jgi:hypothetical protein